MVYKNYSMDSEKQTAQLIVIPDMKNILFKLSNESEEIDEVVSFTVEEFKEFEFMVREVLMYINSKDESQ